MIQESITTTYYLKIVAFLFLGIREGIDFFILEK
jgi:hypothetical protein